MKRLATQKVSDEMHEFLSEKSLQLDESIASVVRGLIRQAMEESKFVQLQRENNKVDKSEV